jgi:hypothetical protein
MLSLTLSLALAAAPATPLTDSTLPTFRDAIRPAPSELKYLDIPWRDSLWRAVAEAQAADKPILFWAVHGQPFGCV